MARDVAVLWSETTNPPTAASQRNRFGYGNDLEAALYDAYRWMTSGNPSPRGDGLLPFVRAGSGIDGSAVFDLAAIRILIEAFPSIALNNAGRTPPW